jgi:hypothetical protein
MNWMSMIDNRYSPCVGHGMPGRPQQRYLSDAPLRVLCI